MGNKIAFYKKRILQLDEKITEDARAIEVMRSSLSDFQYELELIKDCFTSVDVGLEKQIKYEVGKIMSDISQHEERIRLMREKTNQIAFYLSNNGHETIII